MSRQRIAGGEEQGPGFTRVSSVPPWGFEPVLTPPTPTSAKSHDQESRGSYYLASASAVENRTLSKPGAGIHQLPPFNCSFANAIETASFADPNRRQTVP